ncbi:hypothetical protein QFC20_000724 [Naganishia adeliensis]|uniref:Uncharacterized protein n=1 Tax=Naganishia adeliensis TaxID=92952 RepID=A0ACC2WY81_9TREE|nr:hypothetical protein QFC20_000724 [Naganishia adeliensis]
MGLFSHKKKQTAAFQSQATGTPLPHTGPRTAPNLDRQRLLASTVGNPRRFWEEALAARYDLETIQMCARPVQQDVGTSTLIALKGEHWTKEETALQNAISQSRMDLDAGIGSAKECLDNGEIRGHPGLDDQIRDTAVHWRNLIKAWEAYRATQNKTWASRLIPQVGDAAGKVLGLI